MVPDRPGPDGPAAPDGYDPRVHSAVTDLYTYVLVLEAEWRRLGDPAENAGACAASEHGMELTELRAEMAAELEAVREAAAALHEYASADPAKAR